MALRRPLYIDSNDNLRTMDNIHLAKVRTETVRQFGFDPSVLLSYDSDGDSTNSIGTSLDTRLQAGEVSISAGSTPPESTTAEPTTVTITWDKIASSLKALISPSFSSNGFPLYETGGVLHSMTDSDFIDTFVLPAIDRITSSSLDESDNAGGYFISSIDSDIIGTLVNSLPIYTDTRADSALYTASGIGEVLDQPHDIQDYYLFQTNLPVKQSFPRPIYGTLGGNIREYEDSDFRIRLRNRIQFVARNVTGYKIRYSIDSATGPGAIKGTGMANTRLSGTDGLYQTRFVGTQDYRAQEFPYGVPETQETYFLKVKKE